MLETRDVIVTGAPGWLGTRLVGSLVQGLGGHAELAKADPSLRVRCLVQPGQDTAELIRLSDRITFVEGDLQDPEAVNALFATTQEALVFHSAGVIHPRRTAEFQRVNVGGAKNLIEAAVAASARRLVAVSSNSPIGCNPHPEHLFDERSPYHPYMGYGRSKMKMERLVREAFKTGRLETVIVRPPWFYGPGQPPRQTLFFKMIRDGKMPIVGTGENLRSMAYVDNICEGLLLAARAPQAAGEIYWIADQHPYTMNEIVDTVERLLEVEFGQPCAHKRTRLPGLASEVAYGIDYALQALGLYHQKIHVLSEMNKTIACSVEKARKELGYKACVELEEGMRRSIRWCFEQGLLP